MTNEEIATFSNRLTFLPGWSIEIEQDSFFMKGPRVADCEDPTNMIELRWHGDCQSKVNSNTGVIRESLIALCATALHEVLEFARLDGKTIFNPHDPIIEDIIEETMCSFIKKLIRNKDYD